MASTEGGSENVATYIRVGSDNGESCVCTVVVEAATRVSCTFYRTDCPLSQELIIN